MKSSAFSLTLYPVQGYVTPIQRAQFLLAGASHATGTERVWMCVCRQVCQSRASVARSPWSLNLCRKSPWSVTNRPGPGSGTWRGFRLPLLLPQLLPSRSLPPTPHIQDSLEVEPGVITGYLLPPYKSNRLFGLVRLKLTYQPAAVL